MLDSSIFWLRIAVALYSAGLFHSILTVLLRATPAWLPGALALFRAGAIVHAVSFVERWRSVGHLPANSLFETLSMCALLIAWAFLLAEKRYAFTSMSVVLFPLVFLMSLAAALDSPHGGFPNETVRGAWLLVHVALVLLAYAALAVMAVASLFYLIHERRLKAKASPSRLFDRLPPLRTLDRVINVGMGAAFSLLTLGIAVGTTWAFEEWGTKWIGQGRIAIAILTWVLCLAMVFLRFQHGWRGRRAAMMSLTVVGCSALTWAAHVGLRPLVGGQ